MYNMPFKSTKQMKWMFANKPELAKEFARKSKEEGQDLKSLPNKGGRFKRLKKLMKKGD